MLFYNKKRHNQDTFKSLIHRLSAMSEDELNKVGQLLDVIFDVTNYSSKEVEKTPPIISRESSLDETIVAAKNKLKTDQLDKRIEEFKKAKKPKNG